ncbi:TolC family protein [Hippea alviniae]|uniref:TolC family protein n=1 Tax=Hippea alviniae TaxID=1279027 RepID=UPI0003B52498|nr:TolC family protein [Hippea alviniae]
MKRLIVFVLAVFLYSCSIKTASVKPNLQLPKAQKGDTFIDANWWEKFNDKRLVYFVNKALKNNSDLLIAFEKIKQLKAEYGISKANMLPSVDASASMGRAQKSKRLYPYAKPTDDYNLKGSITFEPDLFGKLNSARKSQLYKLLAQKEYAKEIKLNLISQVAETYFDLCSTGMSLKLYEKMLSNTRKILDLTRKKYEIGLASVDDVKNAQITLLKLKTTIDSLKEKFKQDRATLEFLIGSQPKDIFSSKTFSCTLPEPIEIPSFMPSEVIKKRPDIQVALNNLKASEFNLSSQKAKLLPSFNLTVEGGYESNKFREWVMPNTRLWDIFLNALMPIFEFGRIENQIKQADSLRKQALLNYVKTVKNAFREIYVDLSSISTLKSKLNSATVSKNDACSIYENSKKRYENGLEDIVSLLKSKNLCIEHSIGLLNAKSDYLKAEVELYKALGGGW